ncbi:MAG: response regulator [Nitrospirota bacterium]|nr:response regulator [Nitrospirota bacterium]MDH5585155.1 response regulator [Nitrospirota bacterium]MDH5773367.1 response regulator [Nitrospirota bacterium]
MPSVVDPCVGQPIRLFLVGEALAPFQQVLAKSTEIEVIGTARNGKDALDFLSQKNPQVICTQLEMPILDGLDLTREVMSTNPRAILVLSRLDQPEDREKTYQLFEAGALDMFPLPDSESLHAFSECGPAFINKIKILSGVVVLRKRQILPRMTMKPYDCMTGEPKPAFPGMVVIGASTGGPQALKEILSHLPVGFPVPIVCVQHMSQGFLQGLVDWLALDCALPITFAETGERPVGGTVYFPPEGRHVKFDADGQFLVVDGPKVDDHLPSVTVAFQSAAYRFRRHTIGVLLTGMGQDGVDGMGAIAKQGGLTIAQNEQTCVVFGMPQRAIEMKAASHILPLQDIASMLISAVAQFDTCSVADVPQFSFT